MEKGLPENWKDIIAGKKVILYNTSISNLLKGEEKHIEKIEQVIKTFRNQTEAVLWWRPHPLEWSTVESMRPELAIKYKTVRERYIEEGWGIFDTSADVHRAIAVSDAYYGDWSSLIYLYRVTGKPVLLQADDFVKPCNENKIELEIVDLAIDGENIWFITSNYPVLFQANIRNGKITKAITFPEERPFQDYAVYNMVYSENKLILIPGKGKNIIIYKTDTEKMETLAIGVNTERSKFGAVCCTENVLYLFPLYKDEIWEYSISDNRITHKTLCDTNLIIDKNVQKEGDYVYAAKRYGGIVYQYSLTDHRLVKKEIEKYIWIAHYEESEIVICKERREVYLWNNDEGIIDVIAKLPDNYNVSEKTYFFVVNMEETFFLFPCEKNDILCIDVKKKAINRYDKILGKKSFSCVKKQGNWVCAYSDTEQCLYVMEDKGKIVRHVELNGSNVFGQEILKKNIFTNGDDNIVKEPFMAKENDFLLFNENFIRNVCDSDFNTARELRKEFCGQMIHQMIMSR